MGSHPFQESGRDPTLWGREREPSLGEEYVCPGQRPPAPTCLGWTGNLMGLPLAGGVQFELRPQVGPLSLRGRGHWPEAEVCGADLGKALTGRG